MIRGVTTSIRLTPKLRAQLESVTHAIHKGKNWVIIKALEEYLIKWNRQHLAEEARRQSILVSKDEKKENKAWDKDVDISGWV